MCKQGGIYKYECVRHAGAFGEVLQRLLELTKAIHREVLATQLPGALVLNCSHIQLQHPDRQHFR